MDNQQPSKYFLNEDLWFNENGDTNANLSFYNGDYLRIKEPGFCGLYVHRVMYELFIGEIPDGYCINHIDGNKINNAIDNLECITIRENNVHCMDILEKGWKKTQYKPKLTMEQIIELTSLLHNTALSLTNLSKKFNISITAIGYINEGKNLRKYTEKLFNSFPIRKFKVPQPSRKGCHLYSKRKMTDKQIEEMVNLISQGVSRKELVKKYGISHSLISKHLKRLKGSTTIRKE